LPGRPPWIGEFDNWSTTNRFVPIRQASDHGMFKNKHEFFIIANVDAWMQILLLITEYQPEAVRNFD
jgi:hypothetical protein